MNQPTIAMLGLLAATATFPCVAIAGTGGSGKESKPVTPIVETVRESCISGDIGIDIVSQYIARGIPREDSGSILQPYIDLSFKLYEGDGFISKVSLDLAFWNSFHSRGTRAIAGSTTSRWYEADFVSGLSVFLGRNFVVSPYYQAYMSPNDAFSTAHTVGVRVGFNDNDALGPWALHPYALVQWDVDGTFGNGGEEGVYYEVGISPGCQVGRFAFSVPIKAGFGSGGFYAGDEAFGFVSVGVRAEYALAFVPECLGAWTINGHATWYHLGDGTEGAGVPDVRDVDDSEWVFGGGLRVAF
jgi:hypothetical protein